MTVTASIEVTAYWGDIDTLHTLHMIGPYPDEAARDADLTRLRALPGNQGDAKFHPTRKNPDLAEQRCTPDKVAGIKHFNQIVGALYGYEVGDDGGDQ
ncbi:hypothetical protein ABT336_12190 [Micromonospora sp. NPDC000207]|uniref:hypothetical protein n=1 Tax=Micromonospora sp. NPDC000207 TaxID=3154246 RepID=UPI0033213C51